MARVNWPEVRASFKLNHRLTHLAAFWLSSHPRPVREAISRLRENIDKNPYFFMIENGDSLEDAAIVAVSNFINAFPSGISLTSSATQGLSLVYGGISLDPGDVIL